MDPIDPDCLRQLDALLALSNQSWLFGAGISKDANIPLMGALTTQIFSIAEKDSDPRVKQLLEHVKGELPTNSHIEHILSHLGDYAAIAERSKSSKSKFGKLTLELKELQELHATVLSWIAETIRWGYVPATATEPPKIGTRDAPIVTVEGHMQFVAALFNRNQAGVENRRNAVRLFTINYDTLIEDALALSSFTYWDGFSGGSVAHRSHHFGQGDPDNYYRAHVIKLHGSIDWHLGEDDRVWRVRDGDLYPTRLRRVVIYPQSTKYFATQRDPFASQFDIFRRTLGSRSENVLVTCGYSFGDQHINDEIELALQRPDSKTTILACLPEFCPTLDKWRASVWGKRLYILTKAGLFVGAEGPYFPPLTGIDRG